MAWGWENGKWSHQPEHPGVRVPWCNAEIQDRENCPISPGRPCERGSEQKLLRSCPFSLPSTPNFSAKQTKLMPDHSFLNPPNMALKVWDMLSLLERNYTNNIWNFKFPSKLQIYHETDLAEKLLCNNFGADGKEGQGKTMKLIFAAWKWPVWDPCFDPQSPPKKVYVGPFRGSFARKWGTYTFFLGPNMGCLGWGPEEFMLNKVMLFLYPLSQPVKNVFLCKVWAGNKF